MIGTSELRIHRLATAQSARDIRHAFSAFMQALHLPEELQINSMTAVGEALINVVEHAYGGQPGNVEMFARLARDSQLCVDVCDRGTFVHRNEPRINRGLGLNIITAVADVAIKTTDDGTTVHMKFGD